MIKTLTADYSDQLHRLQWELFPQGNSSGTRAIQITAARFSEGVSTITLALAGSLARLFGEDSTLVLEANLRKPSFHETLGTRSPTSIQEALENDELALTAATKMEGLGFSFISADSSHTVRAMQGPEFYVERIGRLIDRFRGKFKYILIDSPPIVPYVDSDIMAGFVDGVAIVVEANSTPSEVLDVAISRLKSINAPIVGLILNKRVFYIPKWLYKFV